MTSAPRDREAHATETRVVYRVSCQHGHGRDWPDPDDARCEFDRLVAGNVQHRSLVECGCVWSLVKVVAETELLAGGMEHQGVLAI